MAISLGLLIIGYLEYIREDIHTVIQNVAIGIKIHRYHFEKPTKFIPRPDIMQQLSGIAYSPPGVDDVPTCVIHGPRGTGKSTVAKAMASEIANDRPVLVVTLEHSVNSENDLAHSIIDAAAKNTKIPEGLHATTVLRAALESINNTGDINQVPVIVLEMDKRFKAKQLETVLLQLKTWGADLKLVHFVIVLSSSFTALGLKIGHTQLRAQYACVGDLSDRQARTYLKERVQNLSEDVVDRICKQIGFRILDLHKLSVLLIREATRNPEASDSDFLQLINAYAKKLHEDYLGA